jgi:hydroxyethylthiazole kinase-like uncharacterized protein yjeF
MRSLSHKFIHKLLKPRKADSHKGDHGHALLIAGSKGRMGAAVIAAKACLRTGSGLLTVIVPPDERAILQIAVPEAMLWMQDEKIDITRFSALGFGPAAGTDAASVATVKKILSDYHIPLLIDADALTVLSANPELLEKVPAGTVLTPHPKEFDRLFGEHPNETARRETAVNIAGEMNIVIVLKGHHTLITNGKQSFLNSTGNSGLAKGGSGDALTGIITAFLAQGYEPLHAAIIGVYIHGLAADMAFKDQSTESMLITDAIDYLGKAFKNISKKN